MSDVTIRACTDGPLLVRGAPVILDDSGTPVTAVRRTVALCRCGVSSIKPWCDGSHKVIVFRRCATTGPESKADPRASPAPNATGECT